MGRRRPNDPGGAPAWQRQSAPKRGVFAGLWPRWTALPDLWRRPLPQGNRRQKQHILPKLSKGLPSRVGFLRAKVKATLGPFQRHGFYSFLNHSRTHCKRRKQRMALPLSQAKCLLFWGRAPAQGPAPGMPPVNSGTEISILHGSPSVRTGTRIFYRPRL